MPATIDARITAYLASLSDIVVIEDANNPDHDQRKANLRELAHIGGADSLCARHDTAELWKRRDTRLFDRVG